jgi:hypothetical protein
VSIFNTTPVDVHHGTILTDETNKKYLTIYAISAAGRNPWRVVTPTFARRIVLNKDADGESNHEEDGRAWDLLSNHDYVLLHGFGFCLHHRNYVHDHLFAPGKNCTVGSTNCNLEGRRRRCG